LDYIKNVIGITQKIYIADNIIIYAKLRKWTNWQMIMLICHVILWH